MRWLLALVASLFAVPAFAANVTATTGWVCAAGEAEPSALTVTIDAGPNRLLVMTLVNENATDPAPSTWTVGGQASSGGMNTTLVVTGAPDHHYYVRFWDETAIAAMSGTSVSYTDGTATTGKLSCYGTVEDVSQTEESAFVDSETINGATQITLTTTSNASDLVIALGRVDAPTTTATYTGITEFADNNGGSAGAGNADSVVVDWSVSDQISAAALVLDDGAPNPTFTAAPAVGTRTTSTIPVNFTSDTTGTVHGVAVTDGSATPTCAQIDAETATGGYKYFHEAVVATVADTGTFTSYTDGTLRDGYFCIEQGTNNYSTVASIANMYKIPAFTTLLTIASQTDTTYTSNSKVLDGPGTVDLVACVKDASAPSVAQVNAGTGGCIINGSEDDATGTMTLNPSGTAYPIYDLYYSGAYGGQVEAAVHALVDEPLDAPAGKQQLTLTSVHATSPYFGTAVVAGDICTIDLATDPGTGTALSITGATSANPISITSTAHGLSTGHLVQFASLPGDFGTNLNGLPFSITGTGSNTFTVAVNGTGFASYTSGGTATRVYPVTDEADGTVSYAAGGSEARQLIDSECYDVSAVANLSFLLVYNNAAPNVIDVPGGADVFFDNALHEIGVDPPTDLSVLSEDFEGDDIDFTLASGTEPTNWVRNAETGIYSGGSPGACGHYSFTIRMTDIYGATTDVANTVDIGPLVPNVVGQTEATAITTIETLCTLDAVAGAAVSHRTIAEGNVVSTSPAIGTLVVPNQVVTYSLSTGPAGVVGGLVFRLDLGL